MPRTYPPRRPHIGYREDADVIAAVDKLAAEKGVERSDILRAATRAYVDQCDHKRPQDTPP